MDAAARGGADGGGRRHAVYGAGYHSSDMARPADAAFEAAVAASPGRKALFGHDTPAFAAVPADRVRLATEPEVIQRFRWANSNQFARLDADAQWFSQLRSSTMGRAGSQSVAAWEAQNLHIATVVREATAAAPGSYALLIVGAAHKPFIERYPRSLADVEIVSSAAILATKPSICSIRGVAIGTSNQSSQPRL